MKNSGIITVSSLKRKLFIWKDETGPNKVASVMHATEFHNLPSFSINIYSR